MSPSITSPRGQSSAAAATAASVPHEEYLKQFGKNLVCLKCPKCNSQMIRNKDAVFDQASRIASTMALALSKVRANPHGPNHTAMVTCCAPCPRCKIAVCMGCGRNQDQVPANSESSRGKPPSSLAAARCCDIGRLPVIWLLLCGIPPAPSTNPKRPQKGASRTASPLSGPRGRGVGYDDPKSQGYPAPSAPSRVQEKKQERRDKDAKLKGYFDVLTRALPRHSNVAPGSESHGSPFKEVAPPIILAMLHRSPLLAEIAEMLLNESIEDVVSRSDVYTSLWGFLHRLMVHPDMNDVIYGQRYEFPPGKALMEATFPSGESWQAKDAEPVKSLASLLHSLSKTARGMLQLDRTNPHLYANDSGKLMIQMCQQICSLADYPCPKNPGNEFDVPMGGIKLSESQRKDALVAWHRFNAVAELDDERIMSRHFYGGTASGMAGHDALPGRMKKLMSEMTTLSSTLPSGIYVRHGSSRLDVMKALIEGPKGTPYEYGLFEFDILCPPEFPLQPPKVHYVPRVFGSINPNLYDDGTVCLSLLGTWQGQPWNPQQSSLLQVLVSIQSMILCEEPWCNEPGREADRGSAASLAYNKKIQGRVIQHHIQPWVCGPRDVLWAEVMKRHLGAKAREMLQSLENWSTTKPASVGAKVDVESLKKAFAKHISAH